MQSAPTSRWDLPGALLLTALLFSAALRLAVTDWALGLNALLILVLIGAPLGLALGYSRFRSLPASLLAVGYSLFALPWALGVALYPVTDWHERLASLNGRLAISLNLWLNGKSVQDTLLFLLLVCLTLWVISLTAGFTWARRSSLWAALLPTWLALLPVQVYDNLRQNRLVFLALCMFLTILLIGRTFLLKKRLYWQANHIQYTRESLRQMNLWLVMLSVAVVLLTWVIPLPARPIPAVQDAWLRISDPWQSARRDLGKLTAGLKGTSSGSSADYYNADLFRLGEKTLLGETGMFTVTAPAAPTGLRYYWRVRAYDQYADGNWTNTTLTSQDLLPSDPLLPITDASTELLPEFTFTLSREGLTGLPSPRQAVQFSRPAEISYFLAGEGRLDLIRLKASEPLHAGDTYQVLVGKFNPSVAQLRQAGQEYPAWVTRRYLQLPENLPERITALAEQLTAERANAYDRVQAITNHLRREITYRTSISRPPLGRDVLDWFLFEYKQGYCNYSATAEVILLRAAGIPARLVVGFAQGQEEVGQAGVFTIRQKDTHTWPEVYFPGVGWVEFEPTTSQPAIVRPSGIFNQGGGNDPSQAEEPGQESPSSGQTPTPQAATATPQPAGSTGGGMNPYLAGYFVIIVLILLLGFILYRRGRQEKVRASASLPVRLRNNLKRHAIQPPRWLTAWADRSEQHPMQRAFNVVWVSLKRLGKPAAQSDSPRTAASNLAECLPAARLEIESLVEQYQRFLFSQQAYDAGLARRAGQAIRSATRRAVFYNSLHRLRRILRLPLKR